VSGVRPVNLRGVDEALLDLIASSQEGVLATVKPDGHPQLSNIYYLWDPDERVARISTTADRLKARNLRRNPGAALYVRGPHFYSWAVAEGDTELTEPSTTPGDAPALETLPLFEAFMGPQDRDEVFARLVAERRLIVRLKVSRVYGMALEKPPRG
jgi:PPOX class probable F420-dependent enzyme